MPGSDPKVSGPKFKAFSPQPILSLYGHIQEGATGRTGEPAQGYVPTGCHAV